MAIGLEPNKFNNLTTDILFNLVAIKTKKDSNTKKAKKQALKTIA